VLAVVTNGSFNDASQAYAAGYVEGFVTADRILQGVRNMGTNYTLTGAVAEWLSNNSLWMASQIAANPQDVYWQQVRRW